MNVSINRKAFLLGGLGLACGGCGGFSSISGLGRAKTSYKYPYKWERAEGEAVTFRFPDPDDCYRFPRDGEGNQMVKVAAVELTAVQRQDVVDAFAKWHAAGGPLFLEVATTVAACVDVMVQQTDEFDATQSNGGDGFGTCGLWAPQPTPILLKRAIIRLKDKLPERVFRYTALHEAGHGIGLDHLSAGNVMYQSQDPLITPLVELQDGDKKAVRERYRA